MHLSGDQHLGTTSHYGMDEFRDGVYAVCTPAISKPVAAPLVPGPPGPERPAGYAEHRRL